MAPYALKRISAISFCSILKGDPDRCPKVNTTIALTKRMIHARGEHLVGILKQIHREQAAPADDLLASMLWVCRFWSLRAH
jgi:hypothetical protein